MTPPNWEDVKGAGAPPSSATVRVLGTKSAGALPSRPAAHWAQGALENGAPGQDLPVGVLAAQGGPHTRQVLGTPKPGMLQDQQGCRNMVPALCAKARLWRFHKHGPRLRRTQKPGLTTPMNGVPRVPFSQHPEIETLET